MAKPHPQLQAVACLSTYTQLYKRKSQKLTDVQRLIKCWSLELAGEGRDWRDVHRIWNFSSIGSSSRDLSYSTETVSTRMKNVCQRPTCLNSWSEGPSEPLGGGAYLDEGGHCGIGFECYCARFLAQFLSFLTVDMTKTSASSSHHPCVPCHEIAQWIKQAWGLEFVSPELT